MSAHGRGSWVGVTVCLLALKVKEVTIFTQTIADTVFLDKANYFNIFLTGDGCIFVWRLPQEMTANMISRLSQLGQPAKSRAYISAPPVSSDQSEVADLLEPATTDNDYRFNIGKLPVWAKKQFFERGGSLTPPSPSPTSLQKGLVFIQLLYLLI